MAPVLQRLRLGLLLGVAGALLLSAQEPQPEYTDLPLAEAGRRIEPNFLPAHEGEKVRVRGVVPTLPIPVAEYTHAIIQDAAGEGLTLQGSHDLLGSLRIGQLIEATGTVGERAGLPVLKVFRLYVLDDASPPALQLKTVAQLNTIGNLGRFIRTEGLVTRISQNSGGNLMEIADAGSSILVFHPFEGPDRSNAFRGFRLGDRVAVTGISGQYCPAPPYNRSFEIVVPSGNAIVRLSRAWIIPPAVAATLVGLLIAALLAWWWRERNLKRQRRVLREIMTVAEDIIGATSLADIAQKIESLPAEALGSPQVELYLFEENAGELQRLRTEKVRLPLSVPLSQPSGTVSSLAAICFRNRSMLLLPNLRRSPLVRDHSRKVPGSALVAPMSARGELIGVMMLLYKKRRKFTPDHQLAFQHLANHVAAAVRFQEQQQIKEQLLRSEKMAAAGQLISGVAADLRVPLSRIEAWLERFQESRQSQRAGTGDINSEVRRALDLVDHLLLFSNMGKREPGALDISALIASLLQRRAGEQQRKHIVIENQMPRSVEVWADIAQIEQALLTVVVHAESAAATGEDKLIRVSSRVTGSRVLVVFETSGNPGTEVRTTNPDVTDYFGFPVAQAIVQSHGGDLRKVAEDRSAGIRFELELPAYPAAAIPEEAENAPGGATRVMTALIVEPDVVAQRQLLLLLADRGHRAIPVTTADEALDLVQRVSFDVVFCSTRVTGLSWLELFSRIRRRVGLFALLTEGYDPDTPQTLTDGEGQILPKPVQERDLDQLLGLADVRWSVARR